MRPAFGAATATSASRWTAWLATFAVSILLTALGLHRFGWMSTPVALNLIGLSLVVAALSLLAGLASSVLIWRRGAPGFMATLSGIVLALGVLLWPLAVLPQVLTLPWLNDVSTDTASPPRFDRLAVVEGRPSRALYPAARFAAAQAEAYPDLQPFLLDRSAEEAFELALDVLKRMHRMRIVTEEPPGGRYGATGLIEAVDRTLVIGFNDDVVVRIVGDQRTARIDIRSASRYGQHDLGRNAARTRRLLKDLQTRLESTVPGTPIGRISRLKDRGKQAVPKRSKDAKDAKGSPKTSQGKGQGGARAGQQTKEAPRRPRQSFE